jgi:aerobic carbon-monoxide dehydrogenase medium subunit
VKPSPLRLERPRSLEEALALLAEHGDDAKVIAGGQSLVPMLNFRLAAPAVLVDLNQLAWLAGIEVGDAHVRVGALCPQRGLERHAAALAACPLLALALPYVGHVATRNRGTVGGSIAHADAAAELPLLLQTLAGEVEVTGRSGARLVPADEFFVSHLTSCLEPDEVVTEVRFPVTGGGWGSGFAEVAPRHGDYAVCAVACALRVADGVVTEARLGAAAVSDRPVRLHAAERALVGSRCEPEALAAAAGEARGAVDPSDGMHASAEYRRHLTGVLAGRSAERAYATAVTT